MKPRSPHGGLEIPRRFRQIRAAGQDTVGPILVPFIAARDAADIDSCSVLQRPALRPRLRRRVKSDLVIEDSSALRYADGADDQTRVVRDGMGLAIVSSAQGTDDIAEGCCVLHDRDAKPDSSAGALYEPLAHSPFVLTQEHAPQLGEPVGRIVEYTEYAFSSIVRATIAVFRSSAACKRVAVGSSTRFASTSTSSLWMGTPASCTDATGSDDYCSSRSRGSVLSKGGLACAGVFPG